MRHPIDPKVDCVFKALLGAERNRRLLIHFLNAVLTGELTVPIVAVEILNPFNEREFLDDKLSIVDIKARDSGGRLYQIEIQLLNIPDLPARILYGWTDLYSAQLHEGESYNQLKPTYSIWLLGQILRANVPENIHRFRLRDEYGRSLVEHGGIWLLELSKYQIETVETEQERWLKFFAEGHRLDAEDLPSWMHTEEMQQAMSTLKAFSEKERAYHQYQARQNYLRQQKSIQDHMENLVAQAEQTRAELEQAQAKMKQTQAEMEQAHVETEQARLEAQQARMEKESALAEIERLKALLRQASGQSDLPEG